MIGVTVTGVEQLTKQLEGLEQSLKNEIMDNALDRAAQKMLDYYVAAAPQSLEGVPPPQKSRGKTVQSRIHRPGALKRSFGITKGTGKQYPTRYVRPRRTDDPETDGWYAHLVEYEYRKHRNTKGSLGFIRKANDAHDAQIRGVMENTINEGIRKFMGA